MGYRNYIACIKHDEYEKIKNFTKEELYKYKEEDLEDGHVGVYDVGEELYEFGKYCEFGEKNKFFESVFLNEELQKEMEDEHEFFIVKKEFLAHIIQYYSDRVKSFYQDLMEGITNEQVTFKEIPGDKANKLFEHIQGNAIEWREKGPYNLEKGNEITNSWKYEYSIFELIRIYKSFDWENDKMIYYGY